MVLWYIVSTSHKYREVKKVSVVHVILFTLIHLWVYTRANIYLTWGDNVYWLLFQLPYPVGKCLRLTISLLYPGSMYLKFSLTYCFVRKKWNILKSSYCMCAFPYFVMHVIMMNVIKLQLLTIEFIFFWHCIYVGFSNYLNKILAICSWNHVRLWMYISNYWLVSLY